MTSMTIKNPEASATDAQISYLDSLVSQRDNGTVAERYRLMKTLGGVTKGQASEWIGELLKSPKKTGQPASTTVTMGYAAKVAAESVHTFGQAMDINAPAPQLTELPAFGYYQIGSTLYYWDVTGKDAYPTLRRLAIMETYTGAKKGSWKKVYGSYNDPKVTSTYMPYNGKKVGYVTGITAKVRVPKVLAEYVLGTTLAAPLSQLMVGALGKQFGFCVRCGATLTDPVSVANGIGPVCATYWA